MNIDNKFLLVCLQLIIVLVMSMIVEGMLNVDAPIESSSYPLQQLLFSSSSASIRQENLNERATRLYHSFSTKEVVILEDRVSTTKNISNNYGDLVLETILKGGSIRIRIRGLLSDKYVCYNRRGRMIPKSKNRARGARCEFREEQDGGNFRYRSVFNDAWVLGFNRRGQPLLGKAIQRDDCFKFLKTSVSKPGNYPEKFLRHQFNITVHNSRIGHKQSDSIIASTNSKVDHRHLRHGKKSHRHRGRGRTHSQRVSSDR